jgi:hypothetical protein
MLVMLVMLVLARMVCCGEEWRIESQCASSFPIRQNYSVSSIRWRAGGLQHAASESQEGGE